MVLVTGTVRLRPEARDALVESARTVVAATLEEPGCHTYGFAFDVGDPDLVHVYEEWEDAEALRMHLDTPHVAAFSAALGPLVASPPQLTRWVGAEARPGLAD